MEHERGRGRFRYEYGAAPSHLIAQAALLLVVGYALFQVAEVTDPYSVLFWLAGAIVAHDLVLLPFYSLLGIAAYIGVAKVLGGRPGLDASMRLAVLNHLRVPAFLCGLLLLLWFPSILRLAEDTFVAAAGHSTEGYLARWLILSAAMFGVSLLVLGARVWRWRSSSARLYSPDRLEQELDRERLDRQQAQNRD